MDSRRASVADRHGSQRQSALDRSRTRDRRLKRRSPAKSRASPPLLTRRRETSIRSRKFKAQFFILRRATRRMNHRKISTARMKTRRSLIKRINNRTIRSRFMKTARSHFMRSRRTFAITMLMQNRNTFAARAARRSAKSARSSRALAASRSVLSAAICAASAMRFSRTSHVVSFNEAATASRI